MASPEYHRRQAQLFSCRSKVASDPETATELERLAAEHSGWARRGESLGKWDSKADQQGKEHKTA